MQRTIEKFFAAKCWPKLYFGFLSEKCRFLVPLLRDVKVPF